MSQPHEGIWYLSKIRQLQIDGYWPTFIPPAPPISGISYIGGGSQPAGQNAISRFDFSSDTVDPVSVADLVEGRSNLGVVSNGTYGWFAGGYVATYSNRIDRMEYSNDTANAIDRADLSGARENLASASNGTNGWFYAGDGIPPWSNQEIDRITYSTDTTNAIFRTNAVSSRWMLQNAGVSNGTYAWVGGGRAVNNNYERHDFGNDTATPLVRAQLNLGRETSASVANGTYGWWTGGSTGGGPGSYINNVERYIFSNDTVNGVDRSDLSYPRQTHGGMTNGTYAWFTGGQTSISPGNLVMDRIDLTNDTVNASARADNSTGGVSATINNSTNAGY